jgi:hypothetical protein
MLQLSLGYVIQADREREVVEDLRSRQALQPQRQVRTSEPAFRPRPAAERQTAARARSIGV